MKYLLVVGLTCDLYCTPPLARLFVDNKLIDEFIISKRQNTLTTAFSTHHIRSINYDKLKPAPFWKDYHKAYNSLPSLKFYEIFIEHNKENISLQIDVKNKDNNYNNGFISKSTFVQSQIFYFFPYDQNILSRFDSIKKKNRLGKHYAWYKREKNILFDIMSNSEWHGENQQIFVNSHMSILSHHHIGGDGSFRCNLVKKYGIYISKFMKNNRYDINFPFLQYLFYKYQQHANH